MSHAQSMHGAPLVGAGAPRGPNAATEINAILVDMIGRVVALRNNVRIFADTVKGEVPPTTTQNSITPMPTCTVHLMSDMSQVLTELGTELNRLGI